jgi:hypothetical protein
MRRPRTHRSLAFVSTVLVTVCFTVAGLLAGVSPAAAQTPSTSDGSSAVLAAPGVPSEPVASAAPVVPPVSFAPAVSFENQQRAPYRRPAPQLPIGVRIFGAVDVEHMLARQSFSATVGTSNLLGFGAGFDVVNLNGRGLFMRVAVSVMSKTGTRSDGTFSNGIALDVTMLPVDIGVGWRFNHVTRTNQVTPFIGGGALFLHYSETTPAGSSADNTIGWFLGAGAFVGVDLRLGSAITVAPEVDVRTVPGAIGNGGLSQVFNESNLGGLAFRVTVGVRLGRR